MALTLSAQNLLPSALIGDGLYNLFNNANAYLGVGDSNTAFVNSQTDLQAAVNKTRKAMDATYPLRAANVVTFRATFATTDANYQWLEWATFNAAAAGQMLNRNVPASSLGTKTSAAVWQLTVTLTFTVS